MKRSAQSHRFSRSSGILLHPTSLPGPFGIGDIGPGAIRWVHTLARARQTWWQFLPLGPPAEANSPYKCFSAFAGNPLLISPESLLREGFLPRNSLRGASFPPGPVDFARVIPWKERLLALAWERFHKSANQRVRFAFEQFCANEKDWLNDFALFMALKETHGGAVWTDWPGPLMRRDAVALLAARRELAETVDRHRFVQFLFFRQWDQLRAAARSLGVKLIGDIPIFVADDSADVWAHADQFLLDARRRPKVVAGVPPDYFSRTGQLWGNPLYDWPAMRRDGYAWWIARFRAAARLADVIRLDHFRGFCGYYAVPAHHSDARRGKWMKGPGRKLFDAVEKKLGALRFIAEDLGEITPDVFALRDALGLPGMRILQFGLGDGPESTFLPHNYERNSVAYTGTHDNDTSRGWYDALPTGQAARTRRYAACSPEMMVREMIRLCWSSVADCAIVPLQDVLNLPGQARMNFPGRAEGNWGWRARKNEVTLSRLKFLAEISETYDRLPSEKR